MKSNLKKFSNEKINKQISILFLLAVIYGSNISNVANAQNIINAQENNNTKENNNAQENNENDTVRVKSDTVTFTVQSLAEQSLKDTVILIKDTVRIKDNMRNAFYIHPITLGQSLSNILFDKSKFIFIYLTFEKPLSLSNSLIIKPSFWNLTEVLTGFFSIEVQNSDLNFGFDFSKQFRIGSDFGIRHYTNGKGEGFYLQGQVGAFYKTTTIVNHPEDDMIINSESKSKSLWLDVTGYAGYCWKYPNIYISVDFGLGYRKNFKHNIFFDVNFCIGGIRMPQ